MQRPLPRFRLRIGTLMIAIGVIALVCWNAISHPRIPWDVVGISLGPLLGALRAGRWGSWRAPAILAGACLGAVVQSLFWTPINLIAILATDRWISSLDALSLSLTFFVAILIMSLFASTIIGPIVWAGHRTWRAFRGPRAARSLDQGVPR